MTTTRRHKWRHGNTFEVRRASDKFRTYGAAIKNKVPVVYDEHEQVKAADGRFFNVIGYMAAVVKGEL